MKTLFILDEAPCGSCMDARGINPRNLVQGTCRGSMDELAQWTEWAGKVLVF